MSWPRTFIDEVRRSGDIVRLVGEVVALKKRGNRWLGLCPFHQEKTPSFSVNDEGLWYCFGCSEGGDIFKFVMQHEGLGFAEAVRSVAERTGIKVPESRPEPRRQDGLPPVRRDRVMAALAAADVYYRRALAGEDGQAARKYVQERGIAPEIAERFGIGYAPAGWESLSRALRREGFDERELEAAGLVKQRGEGSGVYDLLRDRLVFPIRDIRGRATAFGGRLLGPGEPKYINSPETQVFHKSRTLYGMSEARESIRTRGYVLLVEGYLDLLACAQHGFTNVVAPLGTSFTADHATLLSRHVDKVVIAFDGDNAGKSAAERTVRAFLTRGFRVSVLGLPAGQDPDSYLGAEGAAGLSDLLRRASPALGFLVAQISAETDVRSPQGKARALSSLLEFVLEIEDRVERAEWIGRIAEALDINEHLVEQSFGEMRSRGARQQRATDQRRRSDEPGSLASGESTRIALDRIPLAERDLTRAVIAHPSWLPEMIETYGDGGICDVRVAAILAAILEARGEGIVSEPIPAEAVLARCSVDGVPELLSRLSLSDESEPDHEYARACALGIRRDRLRRELRDVQRQIEEALAHGADDVVDLERRKLQLAQAIRGR
jgi:DNA primase